MSFDPGSLRFDAEGLIPTVIRDVTTGGVLMVAWMNGESIRRTLETGETHFWSRSRREIWHKGATSGNRQSVIRIVSDCDSDTLLVDVRTTGPACHTGNGSCFGEEELDRVDLAGLMSLLESRFRERPPDSYSSHLFDSGLDRILKKVGEEATEVVIAAKGESNERLVEEIADLLFHLSVMMVERRIGLREVARELEARTSQRFRSDQMSTRQ